MPERRILVLGGSGRLGRAIYSLRGEHEGLEPVPRSGFDAADPGFELPEGPVPLLVVNAVALSSVAACARDPRRAFVLNSRWPSILAAECRRAGARLVHFSTDLVWSGGAPPYRESSPAVPGSVYGWTKLLGDRAVLRRHPGALILRTSVLFGEAGAATPTFTEELLLGRVPVVWTDCHRNHTPISWLASKALETGLSGASGLVLAAGRDSLTRSAFADMFCERMGLPPVRAGYRPSGVPGDLSLDPVRGPAVVGEAPGALEAFDIEYPLAGEHLPREEAAGM
jgi:dTDP-4-dehydrorhamnose reductase